MRIRRTMIFSIVCLLLSTSAFSQPLGWDPGGIPIVYNTFYGPLGGQEGPDGILGTADDLPVGSIGGWSGYAGGSYHVNPAQYPGALAPLAASVEMNYEVTPAGGNLWNYKWTITNKDTGPFIVYWDNLANGPNFLQWTPLYGTAGPDRIPGNADDVPGQSQTDSKKGGPPVWGVWGGTWNPDMLPPYATAEVPEMGPIPEPATIILLGLGGLALLRKRRA